MTRIKVEPSQLRELSRHFEAASQELRDLESRLAAAICGLDWDVRQRENLEGRAGSARSSARKLSSQAETMYRFLVAKAGI